MVVVVSGGCSQVTPGVLRPFFAKPPSKPRQKKICPTDGKLERPHTQDPALDLGSQKISRTRTRWKLRNCVLFPQHKNRPLEAKRRFENMKPRESVEKERKKRMPLGERKEEEKKETKERRNNKTTLLNWARSVPRVLCWLSQILWQSR